MKRKPDPRRSEEARVERKAFREYLRRKLTEGAQWEDLNIILDWVLARQKRYDKRPGGL